MQKTRKIVQLTQSCSIHQLPQCCPAAVCNAIDIVKLYSWDWSGHNQELSRNWNNQRSSHKTQSHGSIKLGCWWYDCLRGYPLILTLWMVSSAFLASASSDKCKFYTLHEVSYHVEDVVCMLPMTTATPYHWYTNVAIPRAAGHSGDGGTQHGQNCWLWVSCKGRGGMGRGERGKEI